jgi:PAS domain S-box-containing protein
MSRPEFEQQTEAERTTPGVAGGDDATALREELLSAEEELRTQYEELAAVRLELETAAERNEQLFGGSSVAYMITDPQGIILDANRAAWQLFGQTSQPYSRRPIATKFPPDSRRTIRALIGRASVVGEPQTARVTLSRHGEDVDLRVNVQLRTEPQSGAALLRWELVPADASPLLRLVSESAGEGEVNDSEVGRLLSLARTDLAAELSPEQDPDALLASAVELSGRWIPHAKQASVTIANKGGKPRTAASTGDLASSCDQAQIDLGEGPIADVIADHRQRRADDIRDDPRWPRLAARASQLGMRSLLVCELPVLRSGAGTLNLYSDEPHAFTALAELVAPVFAARASIALMHADQVFNLRRAVATRQQIGQAVGILMERHKIDEDTAFERLVTASQQAHVKIRDIAARISQTGEEPEEVTT